MKDKTLTTGDEKEIKNEYFLSYQQEGKTDGKIIKAKDATSAVNKLIDDIGNFSLQYVNKL